MSKGLLIAFEGPEGCGKTTQIELLTKYFNDRGYDVLRTREPGGTRISEKIRDILLDNDNTEMDYMCEALLYAASRAQLINQVIKPALEEGKIVICDRFIYSSMVYQGIGRDLGIETVKKINDAALSGVDADLVFMINLSYEAGLKRKAKQQELDRMENAGDNFHKKVFEGYSKVSEKYDKIIVINGNASVEEVHSDIISHIEKKIN